MSAANTFKPIGFAEMLEATGNYASSGGMLFDWADTHWAPIPDREAERRALQWIADGEDGVVKASNATAAYKTAVLWLPEFAEPTRTAVIPVRNGYLHIDGG